MAWRLIGDVTEGFDEHAQEWDALNARGYNHVLLDSRFVRYLLKYFANAPVLLAVHEGDNRGMALFQRTRSGCWSTFQPSQAPLGLILFERPWETKDNVLQSLLQVLPGYCLELSVLHQDPTYSAVASLRERDGIEVIPYIETPRLVITGEYEDYWRRRSKNLKHNLSRQRRRLEEKGTQITLKEIRNPANITDAVREYGRIESAGWKASEGTALSPDNEQGLFYRDMLEAFAASGEVIIYHLPVDQAVAATNLCLIRNGMLVILKTTYDESIEGFSPAILLHEEIARQQFNTKEATVIEYYGPFKDWHRRWTEETRTMFHLNCHRNGAVQTAKRALKQVRQLLSSKQ